MMSGKTAILFFSLILTTVLPAYAQEPSEFYATKQINFIVSSDVGGGFDTYARLISRHISSYMSGKPSFVVQNMPGYLEHQVDRGRDLTAD